MNFSADQLIPDVAGYLHMQPSSVLFFLGVIITGANALGRLIPNDATGFRGYVRAVCRFIGIVVANRVTSGVTMNDVAMKIIGNSLPESVNTAITNAASAPGALIPDVNAVANAEADMIAATNGTVTPIVKAFPNLPPRGPSEIAVPVEAPQGESS